MSQYKGTPHYEQFQNDSVPLPEYAVTSPTNTNPHMTYSQSQPQVVVHNPGSVQSFVVEPEPVRWSWCNLITAVVSIFCCQVFGIIATIMSILAYVDHKTKDYERSKNKKSVAFGFGIAAIVIGSVTIVGLIIFAIVVVSKADDVINQVNEFSNNNNIMNNLNNNNY